MALVSQHSLRHPASNPDRPAASELARLCASPLERASQNPDRARRRRSLEIGGPESLRCEERVVILAAKNKFGDGRVVK